MQEAGGTVAVAMSGGVDSSLAAALLLEQGYTVSGATMQLWEDDESPRAAAQVCRQLGIPHSRVPMVEAFEQHVMGRFLSEYARGRTPNPCLACNEQLKFGQLLHWAREQGFAWLATGHYARIERGGNAGRTRFSLLRGLDRSRDQSYALYMLGQEQLAHLLLPLGEWSKAAVRREAQRRGLLAAERPESREICFIPDDDYRRFVAERRPQSFQPGPIRDLEGCLLGQHRGLPNYTIGQRKGLGLSGQAEALFVVAIEAAENTLIVGPKPALYRAALEAERVCFVSGQWPQQSLPVQVRIRYQAPLRPAQLVPMPGERGRVEFERPQPAITPGQAVVFYRGEEVLGGGIISKSVL